MCEADGGYLAELLEDDEKNSVFNHVVSGKSCRQSNHADGIFSLGKRC